MKPEPYVIDIPNEYVQFYMFMIQHDSYGLMTYWTQDFYKK